MGAVKRKNTLHKGQIAAKIKARKVMRLITDNPSMGIGSAMLQVGYAPLTAAQPHNLTKGKAWNELLDEYLPEGDLLDTHKALLRASHMERTTFDDPSPDFTDEYISTMFQERGCNVKRIVRRVKENTNDKRNTVDVYFWAPDSRARDSALDMAYKLRGTYAAEKHIHAHFSLASLGESRDTERVEQPTHIDAVEIVN